MNDPNANRAGYKETKVGWIPKGWKCVSLGDVFVESKAKGIEGLETYSVTVDRGLIPRGELDRKMAPDLPPEKSLFLKKGDIAYNMMRMWQGSVAVANQPCVVSPAYVVCRPTNEALSDFMLRYFKSHRGLYELWAYSYGITNDRLRLYYADFGLVPAPLPPLKEQQKIADILTACDEVINKTSALIDAKKKQKSALMHQLLTGKKRLLGFNGKWVDVALKDISKRLKEVAENPIGYPVLSITAGTGFVSQEDKFSRVIAGRQVERYVLLRRGDFSYNKGNSIRYPQGCVYQLDEYEIGLVPNVFYSFRLDDGRVAPEFIKQYFLAGLHNKDLYRWINSGVRNNGLLNLNSSDFFNLSIGLPPLPEQVAIGQLLRDADSEIKGLEEKLAALKRRKKALMQKLITGQIRVKV